MQLLVENGQPKFLAALVSGLTLLVPLARALLLGRLALLILLPCALVFGRLAPLLGETCRVGGLCAAL